MGLELEVGDWTEAIGPSKEERGVQELNIWRQMYKVTEHKGDV